TEMFDAGIAAYLLNPLKSQYTYDDNAKEYLGEILPAKEDLIGKFTYQKAAKDEAFEQEVAKSICYMAYVALKSRTSLLEALENTGMKKLFTDIEMPLLFTLSDMEKEGIGVNAEELKEYGEKLQVRIQELEKKNLFNEVGMACHFSLVEMEKGGFWVNAGRLKELRGKLSVCFQELEKEIL